MREIAVAASLREHPLAGIDQNHREIGARGPRDHIARVLLVTRRIGHDEFALFGGEETVGHIDRDPLFALRGQPIDQQGKIDILTLRAESFRVGLQGHQMILEDHLGVVQQATDQGGFAVVDRSTSNETQQGFVLMRHQIGVDILGDQIVRLVGGFVDGVQK